MYDTALVLGLGASGAAAADLLLGEGTSVTVIDADNTPELRERAEVLRDKGAMVLLGRTAVPEDQFSICVVSPGVPADSDWVKTIEARGTEVLAEIELAWRRCCCRVLAVTGSNGKSTVAKLCRDALADAGCRTRLAGNYGSPLSMEIRNNSDTDWFVVEVSSFQLEKVAEFRPDVGLLLNIFPNHLERHGNMQTYAGIKKKLFARMKEGDTGVVPAGTLGEFTSLRKRRNRWMTFGIGERADCEYRPGHVICREQPPSSPSRNGRSPAQERSISLSGTVFDNEILGISAAASVAAIRACGYPAEHVASAAKSFRPLPHRMEEVLKIRGVGFVDDSKATNIAAMSAALRMSDGPVRLIAGGLLKEKDLLSVKKMLAKKVKSVYLIGNAGPALCAAWHDAVPCRVCADIEEAVRTAWRDAREGEVVLLSPACASFDQFKNFEDRGEQFVKIVKSLKEE